MLAAWLAGCAVGTVRPDGMVQGFALGHAKLETCAGPVELAVCTEVPATLVCQRIEGGALSVSGWEVLGTAVTGAVMYFTGGAL